MAAGLTVELTDDEVDALQRAIEMYCLNVSQLDVDEHPHLEQIVRDLEAVGLRLGMEMEEAPLRCPG